MSKIKALTTLYNEKGKAISKGYDKICKFNLEDEYIKVQMGTLYNIITRKGKEVSKVWFEEVMLQSAKKLCGEYEGNSLIAIVKHDGYYNYLLDNGTLLFKGSNIVEAKWFVEESAIFITEDFKCGCITLEGKIVDIYPDYEIKTGYVNDYAVIIRDGKYNYIDKEGKVISDIWFENALDFNKQGIAMVWREGWNINAINTKGELLLKKDLNRYGFEIFGSVIIAKPLGKIKLIFKDEAKLKDRKIVKVVYNYIGGVIFIHDSTGLVNAVNLDGELLFKEWYTDIDTVTVDNLCVSETFMIVYKKNAKGKTVCTIMNKKGKYAYTHKWFDIIEIPSKTVGNYVDVKHRGTWYRMNLMCKNDLKPLYFV